MVLLENGKRKVYMGPDERKPERQTRHKNFITKVMFLAAVARPQFDYNRRKWFDGKIGLWPFVSKAPALRNSRNRPKGTLVTKPFPVDRNIYLQYITEKLIPTVKTVFPKRRGETVWIQQDNAKTPTRGMTQLSDALGNLMNGTSV